MTATSESHVIRRGKELTAEQEVLVTVHIPLVKAIAVSLFKKTVGGDLDDMISDGYIGLIDAVRKYSPQSDASFETYATYRITGSIVDGLRTFNHIRRSKGVIKRTGTAKTRLEREQEIANGEKEILPPLRAQVVSLLNDTAAASFYSPSNTSDEDVEIPVRDKAPNPLDRLCMDEDERESSAIALSLLNRLPSRQRIVIGQYYFAGLTLAQIGQSLGVTESRICQIHVAALERLKKMSERDRLKPPAPVKHADQPVQQLRDKLLKRSLTPEQQKLAAQIKQHRKLARPGTIEHHLTEMEEVVQTATSMGLYTATMAVDHLGLKVKDPEIFCTSLSTRGLQSVTVVNGRRLFRLYEIQRAMSRKRRYRKGQSP